MGMRLKISYLEHSVWICMDVLCGIYLAIVLTEFTTWRKCVCPLLGLPYKTYGKYLHILVNDVPIDTQIHKSFSVL